MGRLRDAATALTVIEGPAGWGKSTLLANWYHASPHPERIACYAAEATDNDASVYWSYVLEAIGRMAPDAVSEARALLTAIVFSGWHYVGPYGDPFDARSFVFRAVCGVVFTIIYQFRGFAPAVWTHALYDAWVLVL